MENGSIKEVPKEIRQIIRRGGVCFAREMRWPKTETSEIVGEFDQILSEFMEED